MSDSAKRCWFSVRHVVGDDTNFEERVTLWSAAREDQALASAVEEVKRFAQDVGYLDVWDTHRLSSEPIHGSLVFLSTRESELEMDAYIDRHFDAGGERSKEVDEGDDHEEGTPVSESAGQPVEGLCWFAVRNVFRRGPSTFQEHVTLWQAETATTAIALAERRTESLVSSEFEGSEFAQSFWLFEPPGDGQEVFSLIRVSDLQPDAYRKRFFPSVGRQHNNTSR